jgi:CO/xanthine dehydrogenase FAD-binding subunit
MAGFDDPLARGGEMAEFSEFHAPTAITEAVEILGARGAAARVVAGGTDVMVRERRGLIPETETALVSLERIEALRGVRQEGDALVVGGCTTAADLTRDPLVAEHVPILATVADRLASAQIRTRATVGGNLANASPAGDLINPLLLLDAVLVLASKGGDREVDVEAFFTGPGETVLRAGELLREVRFGVPPPERIFRFEKAGTRPAMECSVVTVGIAFTPVEGVLRDVRVAFGSAAPVPLRGHATEAALEGKPLEDAVVEAAARAAAAEVAPISDVRGSADYRRVLVAEFARRLLHAGND